MKNENNWIWRKDGELKLESHGQQHHIKQYYKSTKKMRGRNSLSHIMGLVAFSEGGGILHVVHLVMEDCACCFFKVKYCHGFN